MKTLVKSFASDEEGSASIELMLTVPIMVWILLSTIVYFDVFHHEAIATRASLTIADMVSREDSDPLDDTYIINAREILRSLTETEDAPDIRISVIMYRKDEDDYVTQWSRQLGYSQEVTDAALTSARYLDRLPKMSDTERAILVETRTRYTQRLRVSIAPFSVGPMRDVEFNTFTVISPRYTSSIEFKEPDGTILR